MLVNTLTVLCCYKLYRASLNAYFHVVVGSDTYRSAMAVSSQLAECFKSGFLDQAQLQIGGNITSRLHLASKV